MPRNKGRSETTLVAGGLLVVWVVWCGSLSWLIGLGWLVGLDSLVGLIGLGWSGRLVGSWAASAGPLWAVRDALVTRRDALGPQMGRG